MQAQVCSWLLASLALARRSRSRTVTVAWQIEMAWSCCLCCNSMDSVDRRRRKKIHGKSCNDAKQTLSRLFSVQMNSIPEFSNSTAVLCWQCEKKLKDINSLELKLEGIKAEIQCMIAMMIDQGSPTFSRVPSAPENLIQKRHGDKTEHEHPPSQRVRYDPSLESVHDSVASVS